MTSGGKAGPPPVAAETDTVSITENKEVRACFFMNVFEGQWTTNLMKTVIPDDVG